MSSPGLSPTSSAVRIFGSAVIGPLHVQMNLPCQDACTFQSVPCGVGVIAVADGLGSASKSEVGARLAVHAAVNTALEFLGDPANTETTPDAIVLTGVKGARRALEDRASEDQC